MGEKIYCKDCRYFMANWRPSRCRANYSVHDTFKHQERHYSWCLDINRENDCPAFKRKWWKFWIRK